MRRLPRRRRRVPATTASRSRSRRRPMRAGFGIAVIFQEFSLVPHLDIAQNIFLGRELRGRVPGTIDRARIHAEARRVLDTDRLRHRPAHAGPQARRRAAADGRDRQGAVAERAHPGDGRADRGALRPRDRAAVRDDRAAARQRASPSSTSRTAWPRCSRSATASRCCATAARSPRCCPAETTPDELVRMMVGRTVDTHLSARRLRAARRGRARRARARVATTASPTSTSRCAPARSSACAAWSARAAREVARAIFGADPRHRGRDPSSGERIAGGPAGCRAARHRADPGEPQARRAWR